ncbi:FMN-binding protein [Saccharothrix sp. ST-888]|uniref:FMN-binding protein n=1 Tax=Saccharothrix sp. ST-888 TaxID=1427391 RepID=UPI0005EC4E6C|nr:FMN-binding protein [Saccharothrix sp. ST-888]KJK55066.1 FMN-binding protein [Saccharothrix sp. ST-888]
MRRAVVTSTATVAGVILLLSLKPHAGTATTAQVISTGGGAGATDSAGSGSGPSAGPASGAGAGSGGSRTVTGDAVDTRYGPVQVRLSLSGGRISRIDVLQYPAGSGHDRRINADALPTLNQEAIAAQSAQIDAVSGATYTSDGYTRSLQSALDRAGTR